MGLADYKKHGIIKSVIEDYMFEDEQRNKLQACTENLIEKEYMYNSSFLPNLAYAERCGNRLGSKTSDIESSARHSIKFPRDGVGRAVHNIVATSADRV